jgi:hypothetical protein
VRKLFENLAVSTQHSAVSQTWEVLRPSADWDWVWDWDWVTQASPKGHPSVALGSPKRAPSVEWRKSFVCNKSSKKEGGGEKIAGIADIARDRDRKNQNLTTEMA